MPLASALSLCGSFLSRFFGGVTTVNGISLILRQIPSSVPRMFGLYGY